MLGLEFTLLKCSCLTIIIYTLILSFIHSFIGLGDAWSPGYRVLLSAGLSLRRGGSQEGLLCTAGNLLLFNTRVYENGANVENAYEI